ncbi:MAG: hydroxymethylglutaryl-CoA lyase [Bacteroidetes bacterium CG18_big_fil_WC_8_21_14_2_50_41_14]|nr:MAG: hydroxymethylglutaryl-CoA lyase [Bacteroidetes bacterium CG18_big_fil_WC_8_21_14_2_50_41_14]
MLTNTLTVDNIIKIIETPRDGFQALGTIIPTTEKVQYINQLLRCGFQTVEVGSFVSPRIIPQMADTAEVLNQLDLNGVTSEIAVLTATEKGGQLACSFKQVDQVFFPFSTSPTFLRKNINSTLKQADQTIDGIQNNCLKHSKELVVFFSMGFGSVYGDPWSMDILYEWVDRMMGKELNVFPFSDIFGETDPLVIEKVFRLLIKEFPDAEFGLHLHSLPNKRIEKVAAAYRAGIRRFDTVIGGLGGCPQTGKELVGNLPLEALLEFCDLHKVHHELNLNEIKKARDLSPV